MSRCHSIVPICLFVLVMHPAALSAQGSTATVAGTVRDAQTLVVPGATVTVASADNNFSRSVMTGRDGAFELAGLLPGEYRVSIDLTGFAREERQLRLEVNQRVRLDVVLAPGDVAQRV